MLFDREDREAVRVMGFLYWAWCRTGAYRGFMRFVHRYNWHHCTVLEPDIVSGRQHWCQWCGLRYVEPLPHRVIWKDEDLHKTFAYSERASESENDGH